MLIQECLAYLAPHQLMEESEQLKTVVSPKPNTISMAACRLIPSGIRREAARLCGIRQEPLESWMKKDVDGSNVPELALNSWLMRQAFLQLLAMGLGALILVSATAVLLRGFSTMIKKEDFWYITAIGIIQTAKVLISISGPTARFFLQYPAASLHRVISTWTRRDHDHDVASMMVLPILFAAAPIVTAVICYVLSMIGLVGAVHDYGRYDDTDSRGNMKPALILFYLLVLAQGVLFHLWFSVLIIRSYATVRFTREYFGVGNTNGEELVDRYITQTQDKCIQKGVFCTTNRTLVSFAAELLQSDHQSDHVSAVLVLHVLTTRKERAAGAVKQISSCEQIVGSLFKLLRPKSPLDLDTKKVIAEILTKLACNLRLTDISGAAHSISSLLDPQPRMLRITESRKCMGLGANNEIQTQIANAGGARDKPLIVHGLMILDRLASDPGNCTEICKTTDLVPKILAPVNNGLLNTLGNDPKTIQIVKASLRVLAKLTSGTCESSSKLRRELISGNGTTARNIIWIMRNTSEQEMRILAVEILTRLTQDSPPAGKAQNVLAVDLGSWEVICQEVGDQFPALVALMNAGGTSTEHRAVTAEFLAQICAKSKTDQDRMHRLSSVSNSLSKVLEEIVTTKITDMTDEKRKFLASFLFLAVQIRENLVTAEVFANAVRGLPMRNKMFCRFAEKLKEIIMEMTKESEDVICLVITKATAKLVMWTMSIDPVYAHYFQQENIVDKLNDILNAMGDLERCVVLRGDDADEMKPYETLHTLVEALKSCLVAVLGTGALPAKQHDLATDIQNPTSGNTASARQDSHGSKQHPKCNLSLLLAWNCNSC